MGAFIADEVMAWNLPVITTVRAFGFMIGFELNLQLIEGRYDFKESGKIASIWVTKLLMDAGLLVVPAGPKVLRWLAPMNTTETEAREGLEILHSVLSTLN